MYSMHSNPILSDFLSVFNLNKPTFLIVLIYMDDSKTIEDPHIP